MNIFDKCAKWLCLFIVHLHHFTSCITLNITFCGQSRFLVKLGSCATGLVSQRANRLLVFHHVQGDGLFEHNIGNFGYFFFNNLSF